LDQRLQLVVRLDLLEEEPRLGTGGLCCTPRVGRLFYNKDLLAAAGVEAPSGHPPGRWAWAQAARVGGAARAGRAESGLLLEQVEAYYQLQPLIESAGGGSGISGPDMLDVDVTDKGWEKALSWYADSFESGLSPRGVGGFQTSAVFTDQKVAFFVGG